MGKNKSNGKQQDQQQDQVKVMRTKNGTFVQTGPDSLQVEVNHGGIHQNFSSK